MEPCFIVAFEPRIHIRLRPFKAAVKFSAEGDGVKLILQVLWKRPQIPLVCGELAFVLV